MGISGTTRCNSRIESCGRSWKAWGLRYDVATTAAAVSFEIIEKSGAQSLLNHTVRDRPQLDALVLLAAS